MTPPRADRVAGLVLLAAGLAAALHARRLTVSFLTDPLGPRAFPMVAAGLLALAGAALIAWPAATAAWPGSSSARRLVMACASVLVYALLLAPLGFVLATTLEATALCLLFGGRPVRSLVSAALLSVALYGMFVYALELALPVGRVFGGP